MSRAKNPQPHQEIVPFELLVALQSFLERYPDNPIATMLLATVLYGQALWKKELHDEWTFQLEQAKRPPDDPKALEKTVKITSKILEELLTRAGQTVAMATLHAQYTGVAAVGQALIDKCRELKLASAMPLVDEAQLEVTRLVRISARVAAGGHAHYDDRISALIRETWIITDNAFDGVAIILRSQGVFNDPVYAQRPTVKSSLRPVINAPVPAAKSTKKSKVAKKPAKKDESKSSKPRSGETKKEEPKKDEPPATDPKSTEPQSEDPQKTAGT